MSHLNPETDLSALFGIEIDNGIDPSAPPVGAILCAKCHGRGNFIGYTGRVVGKCFTCDGSGVARSAGVALATDDCPKCAGSGEWRPGRPCFACDGSGKKPTEAEIDVGAISSAFAAARENGIKPPRLQLDGFTFSRAPDHGRNAGAIYVKATGGDYLGKVQNGHFSPVPACDDPTKARIVAAASDPHSAAKAYGLKTGSCSCCGRELTNGLSIELGIGPVCREKFGW